MPRILQDPSAASFPLCHCGVAIAARGHMLFMIKEKGGVNADVFIEFLKRLMVGATHPIFLIVDRGPAHRAKKTKAFVETLGGKLRLFFLPPYFTRPQSR